MFNCVELRAYIRGGGYWEAPCIRGVRYNKWCCKARLTEARKKGCVRGIAVGCVKGCGGFEDSGLPHSRYVSVMRESLTRKQ